MKVENQPQQKKEYSINPHLLVKGLRRERKHSSTDHWAVKQQTLDLWGAKKEKRKKYWMCLMKMLHHVCLIPFCIIDMNYWYDSCKVFFKQLNNLLLSMLPQRVPDLDKKLNSPSPFFFFFCLWDSQWFRGLLPLRPNMKRLKCVVDRDEGTEFGPELKKKKSLRTSALLELMWMTSQVKM